jgi:hypothetical protein
MTIHPALWLGTRKGLLRLEHSKEGYRLARLSLEGVPVTYAACDPRSESIWACLDHGHWGQKLSRSSNGGEDWEDVVAPKYPEGTQRPNGDAATLRYLWSFQHGGDDQPGRLYFGTEPGGLFRSDDDGASFELVRGLWDHPSHTEKFWFGGGRDTPGIHSILVDPRDSRRLTIAISCAGVFRSDDDGETWEGRNKGMTADFLPDPNSSYGQDPHLIVRSKADPDVLWQQNHCGIFRSVDDAAEWTNVSETGGPADFGFAIATHDTDARTAWVVPLLSDEKRNAIDGALAVCRTNDGGESWQRLSKGLPQEAAFDVTYRHCLDTTGDLLAFGTTTGNVFISEDSGESWHCAGSHFPPVYSVRFER